MGEELRGIGRTALWVAKMRAAEGTRPDRLFDDQLAGAFVAASGADAEMKLMTGAEEFLAIRTRFYDSYASDACAAGLRQVVVLAAGLDSRAFRLAWPAGVRLFELDLPAVFEFKEAVLAEQGAVAGCARVTVPADLLGDWPGPLCAAGFDPAVPTAWLAEGLLIYLSTADNDRLVGAVTTLSTPGSRLAFDHMDSSADSRAPIRDTATVMRTMDTGFASSLDDPVAWMTAHGWRATTAKIPALAISYGRPLPPFIDLPATNATTLCTAVR